MRVLMVPSWYTPIGQEKITAGIFHYEQARFLQKYCDVALYWPFDKDIDDVKKGYEFNLLTYRSGHRKICGVKHWDIINHYRKVIKDFHPDIIHAHVASAAGKFSVIVGRIYGIPVVVTEHAPMEMMSINSWTSRSILKCVYKHAIARVGVSDYLTSRLSESFPDCDFITIYNPVADVFFKKTVQWTHDDDSFTCGIVAQFYNKEIKGLQFLLPAIRILLDEGMTLVLHVIGGGKYLAYYKQMCNNYALDGNVVFHGDCNREQVADIVNHMDFMISASLFESAGVNIEEALVMGKPMVVTKSGGGNSLVDKTNAIVVEKGSKEALVQGIKKMIYNYNKFNRKLIAECAREKFSMEKITDRYMMLYKRCMK